MARNAIATGCLFQKLKAIRVPLQTPIACYKSQYNISNIYPDSRFRYEEVTAKGQDNADVFSGYLPIDKLDIAYSRSSGPGGQHVNKVNSKVQVRFHVQTADWLPEQIRNNMVEKLSSKITKDGYLVVSSEKTRKQVLNQADCMEKVRGLIRYAAQTKKEPSQEDLDVMQMRKEKARKGILREKRQRSLTKQFRQSPGMDSS